MSPPQPKKFVDLYGDSVIDDVAQVIREVGTAEVVSRFQALTRAEIDEKTAGDFVTVADRECERVLTERLRSMRDIPVVGEEATAADPSLIAEIADAEAVWVVDPVDGTSNFIDGSTDFAVMVALLEVGQATAAWIWHPETDSMLTAERGEGMRLNGETLTRPHTDRMPLGMLKTKYVPEPARTRLLGAAGNDFENIPHRKCAGIEYAALVAGEFDFLFYWRTLPWDHAPGVLLAEEAGMRAGRPDGSTYEPGGDRPGLLVAPAHQWNALADLIQPAISPDA